MSQGTHLLRSTVTLINNLEDVKFGIDKTLDPLSNELETYEKNFDSWLKLEYFQLDNLVKNGALPSRDMYIEQREVLKHQISTLEMLIKDMRKSQREYNAKGKDIIEKISALPCTFLDENQKPLHEDVIIKQFSLLIGEDVDKQVFSLSSIDKLIEIQINMDDLASLLKKHRKCYMSLVDSITWVKVITSHTKGPYEKQRKVVLKKFEEIMKQDHNGVSDYT